MYVKVHKIICLVIVDVSNIKGYNNFHATISMKD